MKINWQTKKLDDLCEITTGNSNTVDAISDGQYAFFDRSKTIKKSNHFLFDSEALIIPGEGAEFFPRYYAGKFDLHQRAYALLNFNKDTNIKFVEYFLIFEHKYFERVAVGATAKSLRRRHFEDLEIPIPPISDQLRIVKILDSVFEKIDQAKINTEKNLKNSKNLFETYLENVFIQPKKTWQETMMQKVCNIESKLVDPRKKEFLDLVHIGAGNMITKSEELIDLKTSREEKLISGKFLFDNSMVLYSKIRPYLMKVIRPDFSGLCSADIYPLVPQKDLITRDFLFYVLLSKNFTDYAIKGSARAGMPKVNREHLFAYSFYLPLVAEQKLIVKKLDALSEQTKKLELIYQKKLDALEELKKSVLQKAFSGEL